MKRVALLLGCLLSSHAALAEVPEQRRVLVPPPPTELQWSAQSSAPPSAPPSTQVSPNTGAELGSPPPAGPFSEAIPIAAIPSTPGGTHQVTRMKSVGMFSTGIALSIAGGLELIAGSVITGIFMGAGGQASAIGALFGLPILADGTFLLGAGIPLAVVGSSDRTIDVPNERPVSSIIERPQGLHMTIRF